MPAKPLYKFDKKMIGEKIPGIVGVDEAGRGCFAGPVVAGTVWVHRRFYENLTPIRRAGFINDSKQISQETREEIFALIEHWERAGELIFATGTADVREIEALNILGASRLAMLRAVDGVIEKFRAQSSGMLGAGTCPFATAGADDAPLFDKGISFPRMLVDGRPLVPFVWRHEAIVKGDATSLAIALASIVAKVTRDRMMVAFDAEFSGYNFAEHKGYGTPTHIAAIRKNGITPLHRLKFLRNLAGTSPTIIPGLEKLLPPADETPPQSEFQF